MNDNDKRLAEAIWGKGFGEGLPATDDNHEWILARFSTDYTVNDTTAQDKAGNVFVLCLRNWYDE